MKALFINVTYRNANTGLRSPGLFGPFSDRKRAEEVLQMLAQREDVVDAFMEDQGDGESEYPVEKNSAAADR